MSSASPPPALALPDLRLTRRAIALATLVASMALLVVADRLSPDASGMGTHRQLGLPACGWVDGFGLPCMTCGMTTAFAAAADGDLAGAFRAQPFGALLALATGVTAVVSAYVLLTGSAVGGLVFRFLTPRTAAVLGVLAVLAWIYKIAIVRLA